MKLSISRDGIACCVLGERLKKVAEPDIRAAYIRSTSGENRKRLEIDITPDEIDEETIRWMESIADFDSMPLS